MKIGDKVKCINDKDSSSLWHGDAYVVKNINEHGNVLVSPVGCDSSFPHFYKPERFVLVKEKVSKKNISKIDINQEYKLRCGYKVKLLAESLDKDYPIVGQYFDPDTENWYNQTWTSEGKEFPSPEEEEFDLIPAIQEIKIYGTKGEITIYNDLSVYLGKNDVLDEAQLKALVEAYNKIK